MIRCEDSLRVPAKGGALISGRGGTAAWEAKELYSIPLSLSLSRSNQFSLSIFPSLFLSPYLSTLASIDPPPATVELPPPRKASALGAYTSVDSGFSLRPCTSKKKGVDRRRASLQGGAMPRPYARRASWNPPKEQLNYRVNIIKYNRITYII